MFSVFTKLQRNSTNQVENSVKNVYLLGFSCMTREKDWYKTTDQAADIEYR